MCCYPLLFWTTLSVVNLQTEDAIVHHGLPVLCLRIHRLLEQCKMGLCLSSKQCSTVILPKSKMQSQDVFQQ